MQKNISRDLIVWFVTIGGTILGLCGVKDQINSLYFLPNPVFSVSLYFGIVLLLAALLIGFGILSRSLFRRRSLVTYEDIIAERGDLEVLHSFCEQYVGPHFATLSSWYNRYKKNPGTFFIVKEFRRHRFKLREKLAGAFTIIPVREEARRLLERNELNAVTFSPRHIASPSEKPSALYISGVVGSTFRSRALVLSFLKNRLQQAHERGDLPLYTRPMTKDGLRIARAFGFTPINPAIDNQMQCIHKRQLSSLFGSKKYGSRKRRGHQEGP